MLKQDNVQMEILKQMYLFIAMGKVKLIQGTDIPNLANKIIMILIKVVWKLIALKVKLN